MEQPPINTDPLLAEYLVRVLQQLEDRDSDSIERRTALPNKPQIGKLYYFNNAILAHPIINAPGLYVYNAIGYQAL